MGSNAAVTINLDTNTYSGGHATGDTLTGIENITGSDFGDTLVGDAGDNVLTGGKGNDFFSILANFNINNDVAGQDVYDGGEGTDTFPAFKSLTGMNIFPGGFTLRDVDGITITDADHSITATGTINFSSADSR